MSHGRLPRRLVRAFVTALSGAAVAAVATFAGLAVSPRVAQAAPSFDQAMFALVNQDRADNGLGPLRWNDQLTSIAEDAGYGGCGFPVSGRSVDMGLRNYFSHTICGTQNVFNVMQADGVPYQSAGENIGWESGYTDVAAAAAQLNTALMNSPGHRANILNAGYTDVGVGSWSTAPGQTWNGSGSPLGNVWVVTEDFAQLPAGAPVSSTPPPAGPPPGTPIAGPGPGYWLVGADGGIFDFAAPGFFGSMGGHPLVQPVVSATHTPSGHGYWMVAGDGGIFTFGDAGFYGSTGGERLNQPIVGMASTSSGRGYWLVASDGGIFAFGDAGFYGSTGGQRLNQPIVGMAPTPDGRGYWLVASDGGIFAFGDAGFHGSTGGVRLVQPVVGMASTPSGRGYWLVAADGGIFCFGDASYHGSTGGHALAQPIAGMSATPSGQGYWLVARDGGVFAFGDAPFHGSTGGMRLTSPVVSLIG
ncbi:MAG TPA: hypothetical protein VN193_13665 [Candidatus Angelobacter sp.]|jgi:uncharacterized protein YkwD|nr:hypothetical protein [Candidatus Angelobacter sp.]